ncbi:MAG: tRNA-dihydrouridine synthase, partial [Exiguobacterium sp.]
HLDLLRLQLDLQDKFQEDVPRSISNLHRFFKIYVKGFRGASELRHNLMETKSTDEVRALLDAFVEKYHEEEAALAAE